MSTAASALLLGVSDPLKMLSLNSADWLIVTAVVRKALDFDLERRKNEIEAMGHSVAASVARLLR